jgi:hypothetical protein
MKRSLLFLVFALSVTSVQAQETSRFDMKPYAALIAGSSVDLASTLYALHTTPGAHEANPLLAQGGTPGLIAGKLATTGLLVYMLTKIAHAGHPRAATVMGYIGGAALTGLAVRNARIGK